MVEVQLGLIIISDSNRKGPIGQESDQRRVQASLSRDRPGFQLVSSIKIPGGWQQHRLSTERRGVALEAWDECGSLRGCGPARHPGSVHGMTVDAPQSVDGSGDTSGEASGE